MTQIVLSGAVVTLAVDPHLRPEGSSPKSTPGWKGLGRSFRAPSSDAAGSDTGYWPVGKIACCGVAPGSSGIAGTPHEYAVGPAGELLGGVGNGSAAPVCPPRCAKVSPAMSSAAATTNNAGYICLGRVNMA